MNKVTKRFAHKLNLQLFAEGDPEPTPQEPPANPTPEPDKTFTQAELDTIVSQRLERERKKYGDYDEIKSQLTELQTAEDERKKAQMTELERIEAEKSEALKKAQEAEDAGKVKIESANKRLIRAEFTLEAKNAGIEYVEAAFKLVDLAGVSVDDDGNVLGVKDAVKALTEDNPFLVAQNPIKPRTIGDPPPDSEGKTRTLEAQLEEAKKRKDFSKVIELSNKLKGLIK
ncbi:scaffolding protein [Paenibacillus sp. ACRRX]|uniref:phage scaffolding protein n=1 Tax=Paenibacillus sp. ACRRX TaxID=2918206 RepID=UPI001EF3ED54|nr:scaffolding protein [Paenibacillus sp. ACRRX]MCG7407699.1 scaffolding protein [Paenibacillus sp. ACRRX]